MMHHFLALVPLSSTTPTPSRANSSGSKQTRSGFGWLWFSCSAKGVQTEPPVMLLHQAAHCAVGHLVIAPILLLHDGCTRGTWFVHLLLDQGVARVLVSGQLGPENGRQDGGEGGVPLLQAGGSRNLVIGLGQAGQGVEIGLGGGHGHVVDAVRL